MKPQYPWDDDKKVDWSKPFNEVASDYMEKYYDVKMKLIDYYFLHRFWKVACIFSCAISALLLVCLFAEARP